jgi:hypothetical protein
MPSGRGQFVVEQSYNLQGATVYARGTGRKFASLQNFSPVRESPHRVLGLRFSFACAQQASV